MKRIMWGLAVLAALALMPPADVLAGNGVGEIASAKVYGVNIIGYDKCPNSENAQRISVLGTYTDPVLRANGTFDPATFTLDKTNKIFLVAGTDFRVLRSNACDSPDGALLQLPPNVATAYNVFVRLVGKPGGVVTAFTCATLIATGDIVCGGSFTKTRDPGRPSFTNVTKQLLYIGSTPIFDVSIEDEFWVWNTQNRPHAQVWFVDCSEYGSCEFP